MLSEPLVTIIVPVFNSELYIRGCIEALLNQTYQKLQLILINDGSTDRTYDICKEYKDPRILLLTKENGGASSARNLGLQNATGDYIYFADSDDHLEKDAIRKLVVLAEEHQVDCVFFEANNYTDEADIEVKQGGLLQKATYPVQSGNSLLPQLIKNKDYHAAPFLYFVRRDIYEDLSFEEGIMFEDELFTFQMLRRCNRILSLREQLYHRRVRGGSVMTSKGKERFRFFSITRVMEHLIQMEKNTPKDKVLREYLVRVSLLWFGYWKAMPKEGKKQEMQGYHKIRDMILEHRGYGSLELVIRCYGYYPWIICILPNRLIRRAKRRRLK